MTLATLSQETFARVAKALSKCPSAADGGDLGVFQPGDGWLCSDAEQCVHMCASNLVACMNRSAIYLHIKNHRDYVCRFATCINICRLLISSMHQRYVCVPFLHRHIVVGELDPAFDRALAADHHSSDKSGDTA